MQHHLGSGPSVNEAFSLGAVDFNSQLTEFSSRGPVLNDGNGRVKPDVAGSGADIYSSWPDGYYSASGTSMAGPHVTGLVAMIWSANPDLIGKIDLTEQIMVETATYQRASGLCGADDGQHNNEYGYGMINAYRAVRTALEMKGNK